MFAASVAFFAFVALVPALVATLSITSLVTDTDELVEQASDALASSPPETRDFLVGQIESIAASSTDAGIAAIVGTVLAVFSASSAVSNLLTALNVAFEREETRNVVVKRLTAIGFLVGALVVLAAIVFSMGVLPEYLDDWFPSTLGRVVVQVARFVVPLAAMAFGLSWLYRSGPAPAPTSTYELVPGGKKPFLTVGSVAATVLSLLLTWGFGVFARNFGSYNETYGTLAGIIMLLLLLQLVSLAVLIGAEIDSVRKETKLEQARLAAGLD
jgi:membrane protein